MQAATGETSFFKIPVDSVIPRNIRESLEDLFLKISTNNFNRGPWATLIQFGQMCYMLDGCGFDINEKRCIDFGCGHERPYSISSLLHLAGARNIMGIDFSGSSDISDISLGLYCMLTLINTKGFPTGIHSLGTDIESARRRLMDFDHQKLFAGDISGLPHGIYNIIGNYHDLPAPEKKFDFLHSGSVLEHVADIPTLFRSWREEISSDGRIMSSIDLRDHRLYNGTVDNAWQFMVDGQDVSPGFINKWRSAQYLDIFADCGFNVIKMHKVYDEPPSDVLDNLMPEYRDLDEDELKTVELWVTLAPA